MKRKLRSPAVTHDQIFNHALTVIQAAAAARGTKLVTKTNPKSGKLIRFHFDAELDGSIKTASRSIIGIESRGIISVEFSRTRGFRFTIPGDRWKTTSVQPEITRHPLKRLSLYREKLIAWNSQGRPSNLLEFRDFNLLLAALAYTPPAQSVSPHRDSSSQPLAEN